MSEAKPSGCREACSFVRPRAYCYSLHRYTMVDAMLGYCLDGAQELAR